MSIFDTVINTTDKVTSSAQGAAKDLTIRFADLLVAAAGIVAALSWNTAVQSLFASGGALHQFASGGPWVASVVITCFAIGLGYWRSKLLPPTPPKK
jgi:hypothetical protein